MSRFYYRARDKSGTVVEGHIEATDPWHATKSLTQRELQPVEVVAFGFRAALFWLRTQLRDALTRVSLEEKLLFINQMDTGFSVGIPILEVLRSIHQDLRNHYLREIVAKIISDVEQGKTLHEAFGKYPKVFDSAFVGLIRIGESSGKLDETLARLAQMTEQESENQAKIRSAMFYPKLVLGFMGLVIIGVVYFIIPKLRTFLTGLGSDIPGITRFVFGLSTFLIAYWYLVAAAGAAGVYLFRRYAESPGGRIKIDRILLKIPKFGELVLLIELNNFCAMFNLLIASGIPIFESFEIVKTSLRNQLVIDEIDRCRLQVEKGRSLGSTLQESTLFPATFTGLVAMGEAAGSLPKVLTRLARYYQVQIDYRLNNLSKLIEPLLLFVIFGMVLVLALAVMLPIWKVSSALHGR